MHHERQDGSGYHRGASGAEVPAAARVLAAADAFQAITQDRPHRPGLAPEAAAAALAEQAQVGRLDTECVRAVVEAAGQPPPSVRTRWPAGLSDREVEVLRLVAHGLSNWAIAGRLYVSPRTAEHHVQHIYTKIGASTPPPRRCSRWNRTSSATERGWAESPPHSTRRKADSAGRPQELVALPSDSLSDAL
jgi:DNA-binding CsgD family transcriptional regulator